MGDRRGVYRVWWGDLREIDHLGDLVIDVRVMLKFIFKNWDGGMDSVDLPQERGRLGFL
jgi:hypothetical protein